MLSKQPDENDGQAEEHISESDCTRLHIFEHERLSREPEGKGWELLQILISRD